MSGSLLDGGSVASRFRIVDSGWSKAAATESQGADGMVSPSSTTATAAKPWHPDSGLFAFGALAALAFGFMAFSTTFRVGPRKATVVIGETK